jgi:nitrogen regulatory protein PII
MKKEWRKAESNPTLQIAAFKLMASDDELDKLTSNTNKNQHSGQIGITKITVVDVDGTEI